MKHKKLPPVVFAVVIAFLSSSLSIFEGTSQDTPEIFAIPKPAHFSGVERKPRVFRPILPVKHASEVVAQPTYVEPPIPISSSDTDGIIFQNASFVSTRLERIPPPPLMALNVPEPETAEPELQIEIPVPEPEPEEVSKPKKSSSSSSYSSRNSRWRKSSGPRCAT